MSVNCNEKHEFFADGESFSYTLKRAKVKNVNLRLHADGGIFVSANPKVPLAFIEDFLKREVDFIRHGREKLQKKKTALLPLAEGTVFPLFGSPCTLHIATGKRRVLCDSDYLLLTLPDPQDKKTLEKLFYEGLTELAKEYFTSRAHDLYPFFSPHPAAFPKIHIRAMTAKWGICRPTRGEITLNRNLIFLPPLLSDYVICHEYAHFSRADHSPAFYKVLEKTIPDWKEKRKALNAFPLPIFEKSEQN